MDSPVYAVSNLLLIASHGSSPVLSLLSFSRTLSCPPAPFRARFPLSFHCSFASDRPLHHQQLTFLLALFSLAFFITCLLFFSLHNFPILFDFFDILISTTAGSSNCTTPQRNHYRNR